MDFGELTQSLIKRLIMEFIECYDKTNEKLLISVDRPGIIPGLFL